MIVSRAFLIQQAVLNAALQRMPATVKFDGPACAIRWMTYAEDGYMPTRAFTAAIHREFHKLAQKYEALS